MQTQSGRPSGTTVTAALGLPVPRDPADAPPADTAAGPAAVPPAAGRRRGEPRALPVRSDDYAHLSIEGLRLYRKALADEESQVSYWRRILQARLDVLSSGTGGREVDRTRLAPVLSSERVGAGRRALVEVLAVDDIPPLPQLAELWDRRVEDGDEAGRAALELDLRDAEVQLSAYRAALHARISESTGELIARYREQPSLCLTVLPLPPARRAEA